MRSIRVKTASANYPVYVGSGLVAGFGSQLRKITGQRPGRIFVLTSPNIWALWGRQFLSGFKPGQEPAVLFMPPGERHKRLSSVERLATELSGGGADRSSLLVAFGGGIIGDTGGFLAAIYMRGIPYVQIPTTLLAQVDSSVGGKTGVNLSTGKNLIGSFHHPLAVFADVDVLKTLPSRELRAGLFESVKAGIIRDPRLFRYLEQNRDPVLACDGDAMMRVVSASVQMKAGVVGIDERESGLRMILNFGHTLGHAIEAVTGYKKLLHGEAIAWGMLATLNVCRSRQLLPEKDARRMEDLVRAYGPLPRFRAKAPALLDAAGRDKKNKAGTRRFVVTTGIGKAHVVEDVTGEELLAALEPLLREAAR
ncbi:MAG TPA: 3-dehydroquinate synthase [Acidobacteriaceae bacterium]|nr:3-dehydroquinate synthase [Acidobacteriaceae bacterium]